MSAARVSAEEQYKLIMECRQSGLSDQQWCLDHDIKPGTFYNWVNRLRQKGCCDIPVPSGHSYKVTKKQEVVRLDMNEPSASVINDPLPMYGTSYPQQASSLPVMELSIGKASLRIKWNRSYLAYTDDKNFNGVCLLGDITAVDDIFTVCGRTDMRKSINGLCSIVQDQLHMDPRRSAIYLFCGKRCDRFKLLMVSVK